MTTLHKYSTLWMEYPDYTFYPDSENVKKDIGGNVDAAWIKNTCAIRLSRCLNYSGHPVPGAFPELLTVKGGDGKRYALRVREMRTWLEFRFGKPTFDMKKKQGAAFDKGPITTLNGILAFDIVFDDATGHLDLWNGREFTTEYKTSRDWWTRATRISLWPAPR